MEGRPIKTRRKGRAKQDFCSLVENPALFVNREISWVNFNGHVLEEARDTRNPLLERVRFLSIYANNLDEFFMIRVSGLLRQVDRGVLELPPDGMTPSGQLAAIAASIARQNAEAASYWQSNIVPELEQCGVVVRNYQSLSNLEQERMRALFKRDIFPALTPLALDRSHPFPFISNLSLNLAIVVREPGGHEEHFARLKVPTGLFPRLISIPGKIGDASGESAGALQLVFLEDLVAGNLDLLFPGMEVVASHPFRITRDADIEIEDDEASDLLTVIEEQVGMRRTGAPVRIEVGREISEEFVAVIARNLGISVDRFSRESPPIGMADLAELCGLKRPDLLYAPFTPVISQAFEGDQGIFAAVRERDRFLFHPYDSFVPLISFLNAAAKDPAVIAIKMTLYRVGKNSPVVDALMEAREYGKAVSTLIELKARFDEENNIGWARALEREGVHVVYGLLGLKVHAKLCMVVRREKEGIVRYIHLGTGNYNHVTSRVYTDMGLLTTDPVIGEDVADLFNALTGHARICKYRKLLVAPHTIRKEVLAKIAREIACHRRSGGGHLIFKCNALVDRECIVALYRASQEGVRVDLQVRGICCLRPGVTGVSDNITVTTIVGRFLEHARVYYFRNGGDEEVYLGSADLMPRNLDRRVEVLFSVEDPDIRKGLIEEIIPVHLHDTVNARRMKPDGSYERVVPVKGEEELDAQQWCLDHRGCWHYAA